MSSATRTIDHDQIRRWVEERGGKPAHVKRTAKGEDPGVLRIDFPGYSGADSLEATSWDQWFDWFEKDGLAFLYQDEPKSRFNKLVRRTGDEEAGGDAKAAPAGSASGRQGADAQRQRDGSQQQAAGAPRRWSKSKTERVTINDASAEELEAIWGVGPHNAQRIVAYRKAHGPIKGADDLIAIDGIDGATARTIAGQVDFA